MQRFRNHRRYIAPPVAVAMALLSLPIGAAQAGMVSTEQIVQQNHRIGAEAASAARERVLGFVRREDVQKEMRSLGVDPAEAYRRTAALSDAEIAQIAGRMDAMPAGEGVIGPIIGAAILVFIILLVTDLMCWTKVFPFTKCVAK
jgi:hypothetical protein